MQLLLSLIPQNNREIVLKNKLLVKVDTFKKTVTHVPLDIPDNFDINSVSAMVYSGNVLVLAVNAINMIIPTTQLVFINIINGKTNIQICPLSVNITSLISVMPGQLYASGAGNNAMISITFDPVSLKLYSDDIHYQLCDTNVYFSSLCSFKNRWYGSIHGASIESGFSNGEVIELSNQKSIFSNLSQPNNVFFNSDYRICFCESLKGKFHFGNKYVFLNGCCRGVIEDRNKGGYWIGVSDSGICNCLVFVEYSGKISDSIKLEPYGCGCYNIIEAHGIFAKQNMEEKC